MVEVVAAVVLEVEGAAVVEEVEVVEEEVVEVGQVLQVMDGEDIDLIQQIN